MIVSYGLIRMKDQETKGIGNPIMTYKTLL